MPDLAPLRGQVFFEDLGYGKKYWVVVSNNRRNSQLNEVLVARITTSRKPSLPSIVELDSQDAPLVGRVLCDDIGPVYRHELSTPVGALRPATMRKVDAALGHALGL